MTIHATSAAAHVLALLAGATTLAACGGSRSPSATAPASALVATMSVVSGNTQSAPVDTKLPAPLRVRVLDKSGHPVADVVVNFVVTSGLGSVFAAAEETDGQGYAEEIWTLGPHLGPQTVDVRSVDPHTSAAVTYAHFTATGGPPHNITVAFAIGSGDSGIALMNADGTDIKVITICHYCQFDGLPVLSPDHQHVVFVSERSGISPSVSYATTTGTVLHSFDGPTDPFDQDPSFSPDGTLIAAITHFGEGFGEGIGIFDTTGTQVTGIGAHFADCECFHDPAFSPDGTKLVFESDLAGEPDIYTINFIGSTLDSTSIVRLTFDGGSMASWSPDGRHIAFSRGGDTYVMDPDGNNQKAITTGGRGGGFVSWSPNSQLIASDSGLMNADGTNLVKINGGGEGRFAWR